MHKALILVDKCFSYKGEAKLVDCMLHRDIEEMASKLGNIMVSEGLKSHQGIGRTKIS